MKWYDEYATIAKLRCWSFNKSHSESVGKGTAFFWQHAQKASEKDRTIDWAILQLPFLNPSLQAAPRRLCRKRRIKKQKQTSTNQTRFDDVTRLIRSRSTGWRRRWGWRSRPRGRWWGKKTVRPSGCVLASGPRLLWTPWRRRPRGCRCEAGAGWRWSCRARWFRGRPGTAGWRRRGIGSPWTSSS